MGNRCLRGQRTISDASQAIFQREEDLFSQKIIAAEDADITADICQWNPRHLWSTGYDERAAHE